MTKTMQTVGYDQPKDPGSLEALYRAHGPLVSGADLWKLLGFRSPATFRKAKERGRLPVPCFALPSRRGTFAKTIDVARWLQNPSDPDIGPPADQSAD